MEIPDGPEALTPEWLTEALRQNGAITHAKVISFQTQAVGEEDKGITGQLKRVKLNYDLHEPTAPSSLIAKFHAAARKTRAIINTWGMYEREYRFYKHVASRIDLPIPRCYYGDYHKSGLVVLLLEDLSPASSMGHNINASQVELAVRQIAQFHAFWWEHPQLDEITGKEDLNIDNTFLRQVQEDWDSFLTLSKYNLPREMIGIGHRILAIYVKIINQLLFSSPKTLIHFDFSSDNLFFATHEGGTPFLIIDWQLFRQGKGIYDVGYLLSGLSTEQRRKTEMGLLKMYHQILVDNGIKGYSFEQCKDDYGLTMLDIFWRCIYLIRRPIPDKGLNRYHKIDHRISELWFPRICRAIFDLGADKLIPK